MKPKNRKPKPSQPLWVWRDLDGCWFCKNRNACGSCKVMKKYSAEQKERRKRREMVEINYD